MSVNVVLRMGNEQSTKQSHSLKFAINIHYQKHQIYNLINFPVANHVVSNPGGFYVLKQLLLQKPPQLILSQIEI